MLIKYDKTIFVGIIKEASDNEYNASCMHECGPNKFKWPSRTDSCWYESVICKIKGPAPVHNRGVFQLFDDDFEMFISLGY